MNRGFYLTLMMGGFNASPVPQALIDALIDVQVTSTVGSQGGFQIKFSLGKNSPVQQMLNSGFFNPRTRVIIAVTVNGSTEVLMDGIITKQDMTPSSAAGKSTLSITGLDLTALMDFIDFTGIPYPALPEFVIVEAILAKYAVLGVVPLALPASIPNIENPLDRFIKQQGTDYRYVSALWRATRGRCSTWIQDPARARALRTGGPISASSSEERSRRSASTWMPARISTRSAFRMMARSLRSTWSPFWNRLRRFRC
jgi:hypothetical protein